MNKILCTLFATVVVLSGCGYDEDLNSTIFIPDEEDSNLPAYTEWGYNSFGARYDRQYFLASYNEIPCKITYANDLLNFILRGHLDYQPASLHISFPFPEVNEFTDLSPLSNGDTIDLAKPKAEVILTYRIEGKDTSEVLNVTKGGLYFKRYQELYVDNDFSRIILSGYFAFQFLRKDQTGTPVSEYFSDGRFDLGIPLGDILLPQKEEEDTSL
jgi:hypothetical protein